MDTTLLTPTYENGTRTFPALMTFAQPDRIVPPEELMAVAPDSGLNGMFLADLLSSFLAHEQCGTHLYRTVSGLTQNPVFRARYEEFAAETEHHVEVLTRLVTELGGDPLYISPTARLVHAMDTKLIESVVLGAGSAATPLQVEDAMVQAVILAETKDTGDWTFLATLAGGLDQGATKEALESAVSEVLPDEEHHLGWATRAWEQSSLLQARSADLMGVEDMASQLMGTVVDQEA